MKAICINSKPNNKESDHLVYGHEYNVLQSCTHTLLAPPSDFVSATFFLISLPSSPPKRYLSDRFTHTEEIQQREQEKRKQEMEYKIKLARDKNASIILRQLTL